MKKTKTRLVLKKSVRNFLNRLMITIILLLTVFIAIKQDSKVKDFIRKNVFSESLEFTKAKKIYQKYFGKFLSVDNIVKEDIKEDSLYEIQLHKNEQILIRNKS